jgi:arsenate reductase-like glutaredoxin family protein
VNASKQKFTGDDLAALFDGARSVTVAKGKKILEFDLGETDASDADLQKVALGPTGNLRAPAIKTGKRWLIGFHEEAYAAVFD